jgi:hypothetical protein
MDNEGGIMKSYSNWIANTTNTTWKHRHNPNVIVRIRSNFSFPHWHVKYLVYHSHPAPNNGAIMQEPEGAMNMESARKKAEKHLLHWSNSSVWKQDSDYGRIGKTGA